MKNFYTSKEVQEMLCCTTLRTAQLRIQAMNEELKSKGYWIERGKVPVTKNIHISKGNELVENRNPCEHERL